MKHSMEQVAPGQMRRTTTAHRHRLVGVLCCGAGLLALAAATGWWSRVASAQAALAETREAAQKLEQQLSAHNTQDGFLSTFSVKTALDVEHTAMSDDDVSALVRWHALLREHRLRNWQGRSVTPAASPGDSTGGALWRLEGLASYEQGVVLLNAMASQFPRLLVLQVQVQQMPATELLQWRLELRWSAPMPALAQRWPFGEISTAASWINPFAGHRLPVHTRFAPASDTRASQAEVDPNHVLPKAPLKDIRLIGVVAQDEERVALVSWTAAPADTASQAGRLSSSVLSYRVQKGQSLGVEQAQVVAVEPQALVLQTLRNASTGHRQGARELLALADARAGQPAREASRP